MKISNHLFALAVFNSEYSQVNINHATKDAYFGNLIRNAYLVGTEFHVFSRPLSYLIFCRFGELKTIEIVNRKTYVSGDFSHFENTKSVYKSIKRNAKKQRCRNNQFKTTIEL